MKASNLTLTDNRFTLIDEVFPQVFLYEMRSYADYRGRFDKVYGSELSCFQDFKVEQLNLVNTDKPFTMRGLHYQSLELAESKCFRCFKGAAELMFAKVDEVDGQGILGGTVFLDHPKLMLKIGRGFATGYCTTQADTMMLYFSDRQYVPEAENGLRFDDPSLQFRLKTRVEHQSAKDKAWADYSVQNPRNL